MGLLELGNINTSKYGDYDMNNLCSKYNEAQTKTRKKCTCFTLEDKWKIVNEFFPGIFFTKFDLHDSIQSTSLNEYPETFFTKKNLLNSNYNDLGYCDYEMFFYLYGDSNGKAKHILKEVLTSDISNPPIILKGTNELFFVLSGDVEMMAFKVLGIIPLVKIIEINTKISHLYFA